MNNLYNADCLDILKNMPSDTIDLVIIDPPYNIATDMGGGTFGKANRTYRTELKDKGLCNGISNEVLDELVRVMKKVNIYIWCNKAQLRQLIDYFDDLGCKMDLLTWHKTNPVPACHNKYLSDTEYLLYFRKDKVPMHGSYATKKKYYVTPLNKKEKDKYNHPTVKPLHIIENLVINSSSEGDTVLDCYMGSGTTGVACKKLNRKFIGVEINKEYFDTAKIRMEAENDN